jgi:hypothetical protein
VASLRDVPITRDVCRCFQSGGSPSNVSEHDHIDPSLFHAAVGGRVAFGVIEERDGIVADFEVAGSADGVVEVTKRGGHSAESSEVPQQHPSLELVGTASRPAG